MKKLSIFIACVLLSGNISAQTVLSHCTAPDSILQKYKTDADHLALRRIYSTNSPYKDSVVINKAISNNYLKALLAVYNATLLPARDTVVNFQIHSHLQYLCNNIIIYGDSASQWMHNIKNQIFPTGYNALDSLMNLYYLVEYQFASYSSGIYNIAILKSDTNFNVLALAKTFTASAPLVKYPQANYLYGDGPNISDSIGVNYTELIYTYKWGDCIAGCIFYRSWRFRIYSDCSVEYLGSYGTSLSVGLNKIVKAIEEVKLYPNPFSHQLNVDFRTVETQTIKLLITNNLGEVVYALTNPKPKQEIDLSFLSSGIYYLKVESDDGQKVFKIIKVQ